MDKRLKMNEMYLYGGGGHGKVIIDIITAALNRKVLKGVFDDNPQKKSQDFYGTVILGSVEAFKGPIENLIIAIGDNAIRMQKASQVSHKVQQFPVLIHPSAIVSASAKIGEGTVIMPGAIINADARIGKHCIINTGAIVEHDCVIGDFTHIAPNSTLTGGVQIGSLTLVGAQSVIVPYKTVGSGCLIGAGSVVTRNIPDNAIVRGNPARVIKIKTDD